MLIAATLISRYPYQYRLAGALLMCPPTELVLVMRRIFSSRDCAAMLERLDGSKTFLGTAAVIYGDNRVVLLHKASKQTLFTERARCVFEGHFSLNLNGCRSCARMYVAHQLVR